jgi:hypothetical protein
MTKNIKVTFVFSAICLFALLLFVPKNCNHHLEFDKPEVHSSDSNIKLSHDNLLQSTERNNKFRSKDRSLEKGDDKAASVLNTRTAVNDVIKRLKEDEKRRTKLTEVKDLEHGQILRFSTTPNNNFENFLYSISSEVAAANGLSTSQVMHAIEEETSAYFISEGKVRETIVDRPYDSNKSIKFTSGVFSNSVGATTVGSRISVDGPIESGSVSFLSEEQWRYKHFLELAPFENDQQ